MSRFVLPVLLAIVIAMLGYKGFTHVTHSVSAALEKAMTPPEDKAGRPVYQR